MKRFFVLLMMLLVTVIAVIAQEQPDTIPSNIIIGGESWLDILKSNWSVLALILLSIVDTILSRAGKIRPGSFLDMLINWVYKIIRKQIPSPKARFMSGEKLKKVLDDEQLKAVRK